MFTSRAEYRLMLREDNADLRLTEIGYRLGAVSQVAHERLEQKKRDMATLLNLLNSFQLTPCRETNSVLAALGSAPIINKSSLAQLLRRPELTLGDLIPLSPTIGDYPAHVATQLEADIK